jgi:hypothetical protein
VTDDENAKAGAEAEEQEPDLINRVVRVVDQQGVVIEEDGLGLAEGNAMTFPIESVLILVPLEPEVTHIYTVATL